MKARLLILSSTLLLMVVLAVSCGNNLENSMDYLKKVDPKFVGQEIEETLPNGIGEVQIYRNSEAIRIVLLKRHLILGWRHELIDELKFDAGPGIRYLEINADENTTIPLVCGFIYDDLENYRPLKIRSEKNNFDIFTSSNLTFESNIRGWYVFPSYELRNPEGLELYDMETKEVILKNR